jgi:exodeoxyribonuclease-3
VTVVASWNVNSIRTRLDHVLQWLGDAKPDVVGIQETKSQDGNFPLDALTAAGYQVHFSGQKSYNGVAALSRHPPLSVDKAIPAFGDPQKRVLGLRFENYYFLNLYVPNGAQVGSEKYAYKLSWLAALTDWLGTLVDENPHVLVVGDFNIAPEDRDVHDPDAWRDKILCSALEREALQAIFRLGFVDTFRLFGQPDGSFSWWDYRAGAFRRNHGLRIDLVLATDELSAACQSSTVDTEPRRWERPSDHAPVLATFDATAMDGGSAG